MSPSRFLLWLTKVTETINKKIGEIFTADTKVDCYFHSYHVIICIDFSASMHSFNPSSNSMMFDKVRETVKATLFNLKWSVTKNDKINRKSFEFNPKICLTIVGAGVPDFSTMSQFDETTDVDFSWYYNAPSSVFYHDVDQFEIWKLLQRVNSQISRMESMMVKYHRVVKNRHKVDNLDHTLQEIIFVISK